MDEHDQIAKRCGTCDNCEHVERSKSLFMPNPPFSHAKTFDVKYWNQLLCNFPCTQWPTDVAANYMRVMLSSSEDVRPTPKEGVWEKCPGCDMYLPAHDHAGQMKHMESKHPEIIEQRLKDV